MLQTRVQNCIAVWGMRRRSLLLAGFTLIVTMGLFGYQRGSSLPIYLNFTKEWELLRNPKPLETFSWPEDPLKWTTPSVADPPKGLVKFPLKDLEKKYQKRSQHLQEVCKTLSLPKRLQDIKDRNAFRWLMVDETTNTIFCAIAKVAGTNWKRVWMVLSGISKDMDENLNRISIANVHKTFQNRMRLIKQNLSMEELKWKIKTYKKGICVRHPLFRLLSGYRDKIGTQSIRKRMQRFIKEYRSSNNTKDITWPEFIAFLEGHMNFNPHFTSYFSKCLPCAVNYDFIVKHENINSEGDEFLRLIGAPETIEFPKSSRNPVKTDEGIMKSYMKGISEEMIKELNSFHKEDYMLFDYKQWKN